MAHSGRECDKEQSSSCLLRLCVRAVHAATKDKRGANQQEFILEKHRRACAIKTKGKQMTEFHLAFAFAGIDKAKLERRVYVHEKI
jgi:hypothetical protein